jgi:formylglycine-generating enzyme required for sulfatase activity
MKFLEDWISTKGDTDDARFRLDYAKVQLRQDHPRKISALALLLLSAASVVFSAQARSEEPKGPTAPTLSAEQRRLAAERQAAERVRQEQARLTSEAAAMRPGKIFKDCADCPEMVVIPSGSFEMGSEENFSGDRYQDKSHKPVHTVRIGKPFAMGKTEVTQGQWRAVMGNNPSHFSSCGDDCPVEKVSWNDAKSFVQQLSAKTGKSYRLPSEAEWEYACRAGGTQTYCGSKHFKGAAWFDVTSGRKTHPVAGKQANAWGLHDMSGNVWEWVEDCWNDSYSGAPSDGSAWITETCRERVVRGSSWNSSPRRSRFAARLPLPTANRNPASGFRPARMLP